MTTLFTGTRIRTEPNTAGSVLVSVSANVTVQGTELFTAPVELRNASGVYQRVGDKWLKISYNGVMGWMAYIHMGEAICKDFKETVTEPPVEPPPSVQFPQSFTLIDPSGAKAEYVFVREL
jgi:hypothetical protein